MKKGRNHFWVLAREDSDGQFGLRYYKPYGNTYCLRGANWYTNKQNALLDKKNIGSWNRWKPIKVTIHL